MWGVCKVYYKKLWRLRGGGGGGGGGGVDILTTPVSDVHYSVQTLSIYLKIWILVDNSFLI